MTLTKLLQLLRQRLLKALEQDDRDELLTLYTAFTVLRETTYSEQNVALVDVLLNLEDAAQEGTMGVKGKIPVPSIEAIDAACASTEFHTKA